MMEAANRGSFDVGAMSVGLNITLPHEQFPNPYVTPELCFSFHYFALRKLHFLLRAKALVAFPGGYGTFDELFEVLTLVQTRKIKPIPVVLVGEDYWRRAIDFNCLSMKASSTRRTTRAVLVCRNGRGNLEQRLELARSGTTAASRRLRIFLSETFDTPALVPAGADFRGEQNEIVLPRRRSQCDRFMSS